MANFFDLVPAPSFLLSLILILLVIVSGYSSAEVERKVYIAYMGNYVTHEESAPSLHLEILSRVVAHESQENLSKLLIHSYKRSFSGFSAYLTEQEANTLTAMKDVAWVFPSQSYKPRTTRSWDFIGLPLNVSRRSSSESSNIIIGVIDTGVWPESESFQDQGLGPPPRKWRGTCQASETFKCNNKIIGARSYMTRGDRRFVGSAGFTEASARDFSGHGTHMASTAAGREVVGASLYGIAEGVARGGVPSARIAVYKACWSSAGHYVCATEDLLAAFDDAISDGVDLILAATSQQTSSSYFQDAMAIGSFHAMQRGILTSAPATDFGDMQYFSVANTAPWMLTVGASSIDRKFTDTVVLGDGSTYKALELNSFVSQEKLLPLIYGGDAPKTGAEKFYREASKSCVAGSLNRNLVKGKIVVCDSSMAADEGVTSAGAAGYIYSSGSANNLPCEVVPGFLPSIPAICLGTNQIEQVKNYTRSTRRARARILRSESIHDPLAPQVAYFSGKGPNTFTMDILKPDITAPGLGILAAWSPKARLAGGSRSVRYNLFSGTSTASAHAAGLAAYVKSFHPTWSPAAIRSALITTALPMTYPPNKLAGPLVYGAGQVNARRVLDPGLVYDAHEQDYVRMLCNQGYDTQKLRALTGDLQVCSHTTNGTVWDLNYPSISLCPIKPRGDVTPFNATFRRTVTNVDGARPRSTYRAIIDNPCADWFQIDVEPRVLSFKTLLEKRSFSVRIRGIGRPRTASASLLWTDGVHHVRTPIFAQLYFPN